MTGPSRLEILGNKISAGFYADAVLMAIYKRRRGIELLEHDKEHLEKLLEFLEWLSGYSEKDAFELAVTAPLRYTNSSDARILEPYIKIKDIQTLVPKLVEELKLFLEGSTTADSVEKFFKKISKQTSYGIDELNDTY